MGKGGKKSLEGIKCRWRGEMDRLTWSEGADSRVMKDEVFKTVEIGEG